MARRLTLILALAAAAVAAPARADDAPWLAGDWTVRRVVELAAAPEGDDAVAVVEFYAGGMVRGDGGDVRVAAEGRRLVPSRVLQVGPADFVRVAFAPVRGQARYHVYYGDPEAPTPEPWEPKAGCLALVRKWPGGPTNRLDRVRQTFEKAGAVGAGFVDAINLGYCPFAPADTSAVYQFVGWFNAPDTGTYSFATTSAGPSWLLVDGREVAAYDGRRGPVADARSAGAIAIPRGLHRIDYWYVDASGPMTAVAAWKRPGAERFEPIPPEAFVPVARARLAETDLKGERLVADFHPEHVGEAWWPEGYAVRVRFANLTKPPGPRSQVTYEWDFGDGQTSTVPAPVHIYLAEGDYEVRLTASVARLSQTFVTRIRVERDWSWQTRRSLESPARYAEQIQEYDLEKLPPALLAEAVDLFADAEMTAPLVRSARRLVLEVAPPDDAKTWRYAELLVEALREERRFGEAVDALAALEARAKAPRRKAEAMVARADILLADLHRWSEAEALYQGVLKDYAAAAGDAVRRRALAGLGDVRRHEGKGEEAARLYAQAEAIVLRAQPPQVAAVRVGTLARYVEEYTREKEWKWAFQALRDWAWEFPREKLGGHWSYLRAQALVARGEREEALLEARDLLAANPESAYAVRLLMLAARIQEEAGRKDQARLLLQTAVEDYPEDGYHDEAARRLEALGGALME